MWTEARRKAMQLGVCCVLLWSLIPTPLAAQVRKLHTRDLTRLSQVQVADYLKRSDIIFIPVGAVETLYAVEKKLRIIDGYGPPTRPYVDVPPVAGVGHGATEAPRGMLYHRYELTAEGTVASALMVPPTAQNQGAIEDDLLRLAQRAIGEQDPGDDALTALCERAIRNHDPCISCSTHFLDLKIVRTSGAIPDETSGGCDA